MKKKTTAGPRAQLRAALVTITDAKDNPHIDAALDELTEAIAEYRAHSRPLVDKDGQRSAFSISETRRDLRALSGVFSKALTALKEASPDAQFALECQLDRLDTGVTQLKRELQRATTALASALAEEKRVPDRQPNYHRNMLAMQVARTMRDTLGIRPKSTRHTHVSHYGSRDGAKYSHLLELVLHLADGKSTDLEKSISAGLRLLKDPALPQNSRK